MNSSRVYELRGEPDKYPGFIQVFKSEEGDPEGWKEVMAIQSLERGSEPFGADYIPVPLEFNNEGRRKNAAGDICLSMKPFIIFSDKARRVLDAFLAPAGEFLEVAAPVTGFTGYRVLKRLEGCIDLEQSVYVQADNGKVMVRKATMYEAKARDHDIFAVVESPTGLFVSEAFKAAVETAKLKGFNFSREVPLV